jgi:hypothetical protein
MSFNPLLCSCFRRPPSCHDDDGWMSLLAQKAQTIVINLAFFRSDFPPKTWFFARTVVKNTPLYVVARKQIMRLEIALVYFKQCTAVFII